MITANDRPWSLTSSGSSAAAQSVASVCSAPRTRGHVNGAEGGLRHCLETLTNPSGGSQAKDRVGVSSAGMNDALVVATRNIFD